MPAMLSHYLLGRRVLRQEALPPVPRPDAFMIGVQGPDILFFHRVYPWQSGKASFRLGNALHDAQPSRLWNALQAVLHDTSESERAVVFSYILGFLCHYAADRTLHPFICAQQAALEQREPRYARRSGPYHYRVESALDTEFLRSETGQRVSRVVLTTVLPAPDRRRDCILAHFYHRLLKTVLHETVSEASLCKLTADMRESMWLMTDRHGGKYALLTLAEQATHTGALLSSLLRTERADGRVYLNEARVPWQDADGVTHTDSFYDLCTRTVELSVSLANGFADGASGQDMTQETDFAGRRFGSR